MARSNSWHAYHLGPIDWGWPNLKTVTETLRTLPDERFVEDSPYEDSYAEKIRAFLEDWDAARLAAAGVGWEGDFSVEPRVFWLPVEFDFWYGFVFKQSNNGSTFVVSPERLIYLERDSLKFG